ncbi:hypothetical protein MKX03_033809 [Papaver bracteatum]|nr:hypothetical protein MKX03_033809 [Papaver bracteatum]
MLGSETLEEGECRIQIGSLQLTETNLGLTEMGSRGDVTVNQAFNSKTRKRRAKKKNKNKKTDLSPAIKNLNKFVIDICKCLKEGKTYKLVWNAVGIVGVDTIQACGGQMTADGKHPPWRQFKEQAPKELDPSLQKTAQSSVCGPMISPHIRWLCPCTSSKQQNRTFSNINRERASVMNRIWVPVILQVHMNVEDALWWSSISYGMGKRKWSTICVL